VVTEVTSKGIPLMTTEFAVNDVCCVALELSKSTWFCAFAHRRADGQVFTG